MPRIPASVWRDLDNFVKSVPLPVARDGAKNARVRVRPVRFNGGLESGIVAVPAGDYVARTVSNTEQGARFEKNYFGDVEVTPLVQEWALEHFPKNRPIPKIGSRMKVNYWSKKYRTGEQNQFMKKSVPTPAQIKSVLDKQFAKNIKGGILYGK